MASSEAQNVDETEKKNDPETMNREEPEKILNAARVSALDTILMSLLRIRDHVLKNKNSTNDQEGFTKDGLRDYLARNLTLTNPMEPNGAVAMFGKIMELLRLCSSESVGKDPLSPLFEVHDSANKTCNRCKKDTEYPAQHSCGVIMIANTLREIKHAFPAFTFERVLKASMLTLKMPCDKEGCGKENYVERMIKELPSVFTIALEWENNESKEEITNTISVLGTKIDIKEIYKYTGGILFTMYNLASMVCMCGDEYNCVAYENTKWVLQSSNEKEVIGEGDWKSVVNLCESMNTLPVILFFEKTVKNDELMFGSFVNDLKPKKSFVNGKGEEKDEERE